MASFASLASLCGEIDPDDFWAYFFETAVVSSVYSTIPSPEQLTMPRSPDCGRNFALNTENEKKSNVKITIELLVDWNMEVTWKYWLDVPLSIARVPVHWMDLWQQLFDHRSRTVNIDLYRSMIPYLRILCAPSAVCTSQDFVDNSNCLFFFKSKKEKNKRMKTKRKKQDHVILVFLAFWQCRIINKRKWWLCHSYHKRPIYLANYIFANVTRQIF